jgi:hypothetical protein
VWLVRRLHVTSRERNCATEFNGRRSSDWPSADGRGSAADPPTTTATTKKCNGHDKTDQRRTGTGRTGRGRGRQTDKRLNGRHRGSDATAFSSCCFTRYQRSMTNISGSLSNDVLQSGDLIACSSPITCFHMNLHETELQVLSRLVLHGPSSCGRSAVAHLPAALVPNRRLWLSGSSYLEKPSSRGYAICSQCTRTGSE